MILVYHKVDLVTPTMWWLTPADLERHITSLKGNHFVYLDDYASRNTEVVMTFDDAYENVYQHALPILAAYNVPFEVFVIGDQIGRWNDFDSHCEPPARHMNLAHLEEIVRGGGRLQWHSRTHRNLPDLTGPEIEVEMTVPDDLQKRFPRPHFSWFSYPGGELDDRAVEVARRKFSGAVSVFQGQPADKWQLNRMTVERDTLLHNAPVFRQHPIVTEDHSDRRTVTRLIEQRLTSGTRIDLLPLWCGNSTGGVDETPEWQDWTERETTPDQTRIEDVLWKEDMRGTVLLHVGVGNSSLAERFHQVVHGIDGVTVQEGECHRARGLRLSNYRAIVANKYGLDLPSAFNRKYDYIIDNNPTAFCCCRRHLATMLANYAAMLKPAGIVLTDRVGLGWTSPPNDPRWGLTVSEWFQIATPFGLTGMTYTDFVVGLKHEAA